ncbi:MAG: hypothetical protein RRB13_00850 [bacterium]|nr:hypothetical protein [bacterium]
MDFDRLMVKLEIERVLDQLVKAFQDVEQRSLMEYYHELFRDLKSLIDPICEFGSAAHLMVMLPERLRDIEKELGRPLELDPSFKQLIKF